MHIYSFIGATEILKLILETNVPFKPNLSTEQIESAIDLLQGSKQQLKPGMALQSDKMFVEVDKPTVLIQAHHNLDELFNTLKLRKGSSFELVFKLVLFFNSLASIKGAKKYTPVVSLTSKERFHYCSPQLFKLMAILKISDY